MTAADRNTTADALDAMADKDAADYDVMQLGRIQPEPYRTQMLSLARDMSEARSLMRRAARLLRTTDTDTDTDSGPTVEIGGQVMTQAQFDAARYPLLNSVPRYTPCPKCNDEQVICTHDGDIIGPCDCTELPVGDTAARARYADLIEQLRSYSDRSCHAAATLITDLLAEVDRLTADQAHSLGCEHSVDPPHRCTEGTCYRQWQADEIGRLAAERDAAVARADLTEQVLNEQTAETIRERERADAAVDRADTNLGRANRWTELCETLGLPVDYAVETVLMALADRGTDR